MTIKSGHMKPASVLTHEPRIVQLQDQAIVGVAGFISFTRFDVAPLWQALMPVYAAIPHVQNQTRLSVAVYPNNFFESFNPEQTFQKWAAVPVTMIESSLPQPCTSMTIPSGMYAVFQHKGNFEAFAHTVQYIHNQWLPQSPYQLDNRPHFEILTDTYKNNHPDSEEEVWIPVTHKTGKP